MLELPTSNFQPSTSSAKPPPGPPFIPLSGFGIPVTNRQQDGTFPEYTPLLKCGASGSARLSRSVSERSTRVTVRLIHSRGALPRAVLLAAAAMLGIAKCRDRCIRASPRFFTFVNPYLKGGEPISNLPHFSRFDLISTDKLVASG